MGKIIVYNDFDLIEALQNLVDVRCRTWEAEALRYRVQLGEIIRILNKSVEVMIEDNKKQ